MLPGWGRGYQGSGQTGLSGDSAHTFSSLFQRRMFSDNTYVDNTYGAFFEDRIVARDMTFTVVCQADLFESHAFGGIATHLSLLRFLRKL